MEDGMMRVINDLRQKSAEYRAKAEKIDATIKSLQEIFGPQMLLPEAAVETVNSGPVFVPSWAYQNMTITEAAIRHLRATGAPMKTRDIADALEAGGAHSSDMYRAVYNALDSNEQVHMVLGKRWAFRDWAGN